MKNSDYKYSFIVGYRNRELTRVKASLDSIKNQQLQNFEVIFVDYGSDSNTSIEVRILVNSYSFAKYVYAETRGLLWNRAHALNIGLRLAIGDFVIFSDIDLVFSKTYTIDIEKFIGNNVFLTHRCYYLPETCSLETLSEISERGKDVPYAYVGLLAVNRHKALSLKGYNEYYQIWGAEDVDFINRLKGIGLLQHYINPDNTKLWHIWHPVSTTKKPSPWFLTEQNYLFFNSIKSNFITDFGNIVLPAARPALQAFLNRNYKNGTQLIIEATRGQLAFINFYEVFSKLESKQLCYLEYADKELYYEKGKLLPLVNIINKFLNKIGCFFHYRLTRDINLIEGVKFKDIKEFIDFFVCTNRKAIEDYYYFVSEEKIILVILKK